MSSNNILSAAPSAAPPTYSDMCLLFLFVSFYADFSDFSNIYSTSNAITILFLRELFLFRFLRSAYPRRPPLLSSSYYIVGLYIYIYIYIYWILFIVLFRTQCSSRCDNGRAVHVQGDRPPNIRPERTDIFLQWGRAQHPEAKSNYITPNLPTNIVPTNIAWLKLSWKFPMGLGIPPL